MECVHMHEGVCTWDVCTWGVCTWGVCICMRACVHMRESRNKANTER